MGQTGVRGAVEGWTRPWRCVRAASLPSNVGLAVAVDVEERANAVRRLPERAASAAADGRERDYRLDSQRSRGAVAFNDVSRAFDLESNAHLGPADKERVRRRT